MKRDEDETSTIEVLQMKLEHSLLPVMHHHFQKMTRKQNKSLQLQQMSLKSPAIELIELLKSKQSISGEQLKELVAVKLLTKVPELIWMMESILTLMTQRMHRLLSFRVCENRWRVCVFIDPYAVIGKLFQDVALLWVALLTPTSTLLYDEKKMNEMYLACIRNIFPPLIPHEIEGCMVNQLKIHDRIVSTCPELRPFIKYHMAWMKNVEVAETQAEKKEIHVLSVLDSLSRSMRDMEKSMKKICEVVANQGNLHNDYMMWKMKQSKTPQTPTPSTIPILTSTTTTTTHTDPSNMESPQTFLERNLDERKYGGDKTFDESEDEQEQNKGKQQYNVSDSDSEEEEEEEEEKVKPSRDLKKHRSPSRFLPPSHKAKKRPALKSSPRKEPMLDNKERELVRNILQNPSI